MNKRYSFGAGAVVAGVGVAALLLGLPGVQADAGVVAVHATDYAYQGVPTTLSAGEVRFSFTNDSQAEGHEMSIYRINDGVAETFDQILAEDEARAAQMAAAQQNADPNAPPPAASEPPPAPKMTYFGGTGSAPGEAARMDLVGNLPAGRYGIVCFIPTADETGAPHYKKGMKAEFTVQ